MVAAGLKGSGREQLPPVEPLLEDTGTAVAANGVGSIQPGDLRRSLRSGDTLQEGSF